MSFALFALTVIRLADLATVLETDRRASGIDFCVTGTVSYVLHFHTSLYHLLTEEDGVSVDILGRIVTEPPRAGDRVCFSGSISAQMPNMPRPRLTGFKVLGRSHAMPPISGKAADIMGGQCDFKRSYLVGEVRDAVPSGSDPCWNYLSIIEDGKLYYAPIPTRGASLEQLETLIGSTVRLDGFPDPHNNSRRFLDERRFLVADTNHITVLSSPPKDPFAGAPPISELRRLPMEQISRLGRHRATGRVLTTWGNRHALLSLPDRRHALVSFSSPLDATRPAFSRDTILEVIGYPATDGFTLTLSRSIGRRRGEEHIAKPYVREFNETVFRDWLTANHHGKSRLQGVRIRLVGKIGDFTDEHRERRSFPLAIADRYLEVDFSNVPESVRDLTPGCRVRVIGTCVLATESWSTLSSGAFLNGIRLVLDYPSDLTIIARPPWWTPARLSVLIVLLLLALLAFFVWNRTLRQLSERRGRELFKERTAGALAELKTAERTRLAVELHDSISQILTGAAMQLDAGEIGAAKRILASCRRELRSCLWDLRNHAMDAANFADAVRETVTPHLGGRQLSIDLDFPSASLSEELRHATLRIIREATVNAVRHGHASLIAISGEFDGKRLSFTIVDDGRGFDPSVSQGSSTGHFGILGMRERAKAFNGSVTIVSASGNGTEVSVILEDRTEYDFN